LHGTPGARRQIPVEARALAEQHDLRIIGIDRPGIGSSTAHVYPDVLDWTNDLEIVADTLGIDTSTSSGCPAGVRTPWLPRLPCPTGSSASR
jgi:hypothetical protein